MNKFEGKNHLRPATFARPGDYEFRPFIFDVSKGE